MDLIGKVGVFNAYEDKTWGEKYAGKECVVLEYDDEITQTGLAVRFEEGQELVIAIDEFTVIG